LNNCPLSYKLNLALIYHPLLWMDSAAVPWPSLRQWMPGNYLYWPILLIVCSCAIQHMNVQDCIKKLKSTYTTLHMMKLADSWWLNFIIPGITGNLAGKYWEEVLLRILCLISCVPCALNLCIMELLELGRSSTFRIYVVFLWTLGTCIWIYGLESVFGYFLDYQELAFEFIDFVVVDVVLFWTFRDFTLSLWTYRSFYGNVLDSHGFLFEFVDLQEFLW